MSDFDPTRRGLVSGLGAASLGAASLGAAALSAGAGPVAAARPRRDWRPVAHAVRDAMAFAWEGYVDRAFGHDQIKPVSGGRENFFFPHGPSMGLSIVEALGTLHVMGLDRQFEEGVRWVGDHLDFDVDGSIQVFETVIRMVGGLVSAHLASGDKMLLAKARDLTDRLMPAFTKSPTGLPYRFVNLRTGAVNDKVTFPAEFGSYAPEFGTLGRLVNDRRYYDVAKAAAAAGFERRSKLGLIPDTIDVETGEWKSRRATIGPPSDSYYEYLWGAWRLFGDRDMKRWFDVHTEATLKWQSHRVDGRLWFQQVDFETGAPLDTFQSELASFYAGLLGKGGYRREGRDYALTWAAVQKTFGVLPESFDFGNFTARRKTNALRPELANSCLDLWQIDRDERWRHIAHDHFRAMARTSKAKYGFSGVADITARPMTQDDSCPGYWWAEQMKYYWLIFSDTDRFDYRDNYLSTEGAILRGFK